MNQEREETLVLKKRNLEYNDRYCSRPNILNNINIYYLKERNCERKNLWNKKERMNER